MIVIVSLAIENNFWGYSSWSVILIISWAVENNLVYLRPILVSFIIVIELLRITSGR